MKFKIQNSINSNSFNKFKLVEADSVISKSQPEKKNCSKSHLRKETVQPQFQNHREKHFRAEVNSYKTIDRKHPKVRKSISSKLSEISKLLFRQNLKTIFLEFEAGPASKEAWSRRRKIDLPSPLHQAG